MARTTAQSARVSANGLARALHAAAAYADGDKKSHRHRICLRVAFWEHESRPDAEGVTTFEDRAGLIAAAGGPLRVIAVHAGNVGKYDEFAVDITPRAAALLVKVFAASTGEVILRHDGKTLSVSATDAIFDNQRIEVRALKPENRSDALLIAQRLTTLADTEDCASVSVTAESSIAITAAGKALGCGPVIDVVTAGIDNDLLAARIRYQSAAVGYVRAHEAPPALSPAWEQILDTLIPGSDPWSERAITVQHILDGALPSAPLASLSLAPAAEDAGGVDLDTIGDDAGANQEDVA